MAGRVPARSFLRWLHRWIGLTVGLVFATVSLSGAVLLFQPQFFLWAHGDMIPDNLSPAPGSIDAWVENARTAVPDLGLPIAIWRPHVGHNESEAGMLVFAGRERGGLGNMGFVGAYVAPASGELLGTIDIDRSPAYAPLFLHRDLWAGESGRIVSGVMAVASLLALGIGAYLWWPGRRRALRKLSPRPWRRTFGRAMTLHDWTGFWSLVALLVLTVSGLYLVRPAWVEPALALLPEEHAEELPADGNCPGPIGFDAALAGATKLAPGAVWRGMHPHDAERRVWEIALRRDGDLYNDYGDVRVLADLECGTFALHETAETRPPRHTAEALLFGLHDGSLFGLTGEIIVALFGLVPPVLFVTGTIVWLKKRRARNG